MPAQPRIQPIKDLEPSDIDSVGKHSLKLAELAEARLPTTPGFCITASTFDDFLKLSGLNQKITNHLAGLDFHQTDDIKSRSQKVKNLIQSTSLPDSLKLEITKAYHQLGSHQWVKLTPTFLGQNTESTPQSAQNFIKGDANLLEETRKLWSQNFAPKRLLELKEKSQDFLSSSISITVQKHPSPQASGIIFTQNPQASDKQNLLIHAYWGIHDSKISTLPDIYTVNKHTLALVHLQNNPQSTTLNFSHNQLKTIKLSHRNSQEPKLTHDQIIALAKLAAQAAQHFFFPQKLNWILSENKFYFTGIQKHTSSALRLNALTSTTPAGLKLILKGKPTFPGLVTAPARKIMAPKDLHQLKNQEILVIPWFSPEYLPAVTKAAAIVTDRAHQAHEAILIAKELTIPCITDTKTATKDLRTGSVYTLDASQGTIYQGSPSSQNQQLVKLPPAKEKLNIKTATKIYLASSDEVSATLLGQLDSDGLGEIRGELVIAKTGTHPQKALESKTQLVIEEKIISTLEAFLKSFGDRPVFYRLSDPHTGLFGSLSGAEHFESKNLNPFLGFRGTLRHLSNKTVSNLEIKAIKTVTSKGFKNLNLVVPFVRSPKELTQIKKSLAISGLSRSQAFKLHLSISTPENIINLENYLKIGLDGVIFNLDDLATLTFGVDIHDPDIAQHYHLASDIVFSFLKKSIPTLNKASVQTNITGQVSTTNPGTIQNLVSLGIGGITITPDMLDLTRQNIYNAELKHLSHR